MKYFFHNMHECLIYIVRKMFHDISSQSRGHPLRATTIYGI